jgi:hypothetical protein
MTKKKLIVLWLLLAVPGLFSGNPHGQSLAGLEGTLKFVHGVVHAGIDKLVTAGRRLLD